MIHKIYVEDIGTKLRTDLQKDISGYTSINYIILKPDDVEITRTATVEDELKGIVSYICVSGDLDIAGSYKIQVEVTFGANKFLSDTVIIEVYEKFE